MLFLFILMSPRIVAGPLRDQHPWRGALPGGEPGSLQGRPCPSHRQSSSQVGAQRAPCVSSALSFLVGSSHRRKSAACPKFDVVWLYRSPIPVGRRGVISSFKWFLPVFATRRGREGEGQHPVGMRGTARISKELRYLQFPVQIFYTMGLMMLDRITVRRFEEANVF